MNIFVLFISWYIFQVVFFWWILLFRYFWINLNDNRSCLTFSSNFLNNEKMSIIFHNIKPWNFKYKISDLISHTIRTRIEYSIIIPNRRHKPRSELEILPITKQHRINWTKIRTFSLQKHPHPIRTERKQDRTYTSVPHIKYCTRCNSTVGCKASVHQARERMGWSKVIELIEGPPNPVSGFRFALCIF